MKAAVRMDEGHKIELQKNDRKTKGRKKERGQIRISCCLTLGATEIHICWIQFAQAPAEAKTLPREI